MQQRQMCNVTVAGSSNVTVNNGSSTTPREAPASGRMVSLPGKRQVLVTPLSSVSIPPASRAPQVQARHGSPFPTGLRARGEVLITSVSKATPPTTTVQHSSEIVSKLLLKAYCKSTKKDPKTFTLRNIPTASITSCEQLKHEIKAQLHDDIVKEFDVGVLRGTTPVSIRTSHDLSEIWNDVLGGETVILWYDGLRHAREAVPKPSTSKRKRSRVESDGESDDDGTLIRGKKGKKRKSSQETREEKVEEIVNTLKEKHKDIHTNAIPYMG